MAHVLSAVQGSVVDIVPIKRALISVSDKTGIVEFASFLSSSGVDLLSTGGTARKLRDAGLAVTDVSTYTGAEECLDGRVKTLHPKIHGGILAVRGNPTHEEQMKRLDMDEIDMTILNLYPFDVATSKSDCTFEGGVENIDIGGPSMLRSTAKNHAFTTIVSSPDQYDAVKSCMERHDGGTTLALRRRLAANAFALSAQYDSTIAQWFASRLSAGNDGGGGGGDAAQGAEESMPKEVPVMETRVYRPEFPLKYGCNPHQKPARILSRLGKGLPLRVRNGTPGYINLLDAVNAYQLVRELRDATNLASAASFKHVGPAGAAVAVPLTEKERLAYEISEEANAALTPSALAYVRARNADPLCSFGDFCALSDVVDVATAKVLQKEVSDGIIAPGYEAEALDILSRKKGGKFIVLETTSDYDDGGVREYREVYGMAFCQTRNDAKITAEHMTKNVVTADADGAESSTTSSSTGRGMPPEDAVRDMMVATICLKYTQSNSVGFAWRGMMVGIGAGQQSRVDCVKLAARKVVTWYCRQHPKVMALKFRDGVKKQERINARVRFIDGGDYTPEELSRWTSNFDPDDVPSEPSLSSQDKREFMNADHARGISLSSDAFFPFRDSIDHASRVGVSYVAQPGGSVQDPQVIEACREYGMIMSFTGVRLFHH